MAVMVVTTEISLPPPPPLSLHAQKQPPRCCRGCICSLQDKRVQPDTASQLTCAVVAVPVSAAAHARLARSSVTATVGADPRQGGHRIQSLAGTTAAVACVGRSPIPRQGVVAGRCLGGAASAAVSGSSDRFERTTLAPQRLIHLEADS